MDEDGPVLALDQIKRAGVPIRMQMSPYLQMDPSIFRDSSPQYVMPVDGSGGKGKFEFALAHIGWAVGCGYAAGSVRGLVPELFNKDTQQLRGRAWLTRMVNATGKHGSGWAQPAGSAVFLYSALEYGIGLLRGADDNGNSLAGGLIAGAIYRSPHGLRSTAIGGGVGLTLAVLWNLLNPDSRQRFLHMMNVH